MYQLYIGNKNYSSWSLRPWLLMKTLDIPFAEQLVPFADGASGASWDRFRAFSPTGKVPCLVDGDSTVWESLGIVEYLAERHPGVWPLDPQARAWARCASAEMHAGFNALRNSCTMNCGVRMQVDRSAPGLQQDIARLSELWNEGLARFGGPYLAGPEFTAVDAFFAPVAFRFQTYALQASDAAQAYPARLLALASMRAWERAALAEPWREPGHEAEAKAAGSWLADLRQAGQ